MNRLGYFGVFLSFGLHAALLIVPSKLFNPSEVSFKQGSTSFISISIKNSEVIPQKKKVISRIKKTQKAQKSSAKSTGVRSDAKALGELTPTYPYRSRLMREEGRVTLRAHIDESGLVTRVDLVQSSGFERLDKEALRTLSQARFEAASIGGKSVKSTQELTFNFDLKD